MKSMKQHFIPAYFILPALLLLLSGTLFAEKNYAQNESLSAEVHESGYLPEILDVIKNYKRPITVLEISSTSPTYTFTLASLYKTVCIALLLGGGIQDTIRKVKEDHYNNITVLAPRNAQYEAFFTLSRCEHFDVVIVHDISQQLRTSGTKFVEALTKLGDHVFIEASYSKFQNALKKKKIPQIASQGESELYLSSKPKTSLDIARFTQRDRPVSATPKYHIKSTFTEKTFNKKGLKQPIKWVDGINLVTFAMLKGVYPEDGQIRKQVAAMKRSHPDHNDLVLGNIIVQGDTLIPIDLNDSRRDADLHRCITSALRAFQDGNLRHRNPEKWIRDYYDMVENPGKHMAKGGKTIVRSDYSS